MVIYPNAFALIYLSLPAHCIGKNHQEEQPAGDPLHPWESRTSLLSWSHPSKSTSCSFHGQARIRDISAKVHTRLPERSQDGSINPSHRALENQHLHPSGQKLLFTTQQHLLLVAFLPHMHTNARTHAHTHTHTHTHTHAHTRKHTHTRTHTLSLSLLYLRFQPFCNLIKNQIKSSWEYGREKKLNEQSKKQGRVCRGLKSSFNSRSGRLQFFFHFCQCFPSHLFLPFSFTLTFLSKFSIK